MASTIEKISIALPPEMVALLRQMWQDARVDKSPGLDPDEVFDALERKYQAIADAAGATQSMR